MIKEDEIGYYMWLVAQVAVMDEYGHLFEHLHSVPFTWTVPTDDARAYDGIALRKEYYGYERKNEPKCTVLEMMVALALRIERDIMQCAECGDRSNVWFWNMIDNLGLSGQTNEYYSKEYVDEVIDRLLNRTYATNGVGGLFSVPETRRNFRRASIWYQMCWSLCQNFDFSIK